VSHLTKLRLRGISATLACLTTFALVASAAIASTDAQPKGYNVMMFFGSDWGNFPNTMDYTSVYNGQSWHYSTKHGGLIGTINGVTLDAPIGDKLLSARVSYGIVGTADFKSYGWNGKGSIPYRRRIVGSDGVTYRPLLLQVSVALDEPGLPLAPIKGGG
jgi:hypothetical protein